MSHETLSESSLGSSGFGSPGLGSDESAEVQRTALHPVGELPEVIGGALKQQRLTDKPLLVPVGSPLRVDNHALLIAAAPELLEAAKDAFAYLDTKYARDGYDWMAKLHAAIAKAEGK